jgi:hypothetical protein
MALTETEKAHLAQWREGVHQRETAQMRAAEDVRREIEAALSDMEDENYGLARVILTRLVEEGLPNDHGGPVTSYPLYDKRLAEITGAQSNCPECEGDESLCDGQECQK